MMTPASDEFELEDIDAEDALNNADLDLTPEDVAHPELILEETSESSEELELVLEEASEVLDEPELSLEDIPDAKEDIDMMLEDSADEPALVLEEPPLEQEEPELVPEETLDANDTDGELSVQIESESEQELALNLEEEFSEDVAPELNDADNVQDQELALNHSEEPSEIDPNSQLQQSLLEQMTALVAAFEKHSHASEDSNPAKQFATGVHFIKTDNNHYLGAKWLRKAAMQGHAKAQLYLGLMFVKGDGVPRSLFHAYCWLSLAACQNNSEAIAARDQLQPHLTAKEINAALKHAADLLEDIHSI